MNALHGLQLNDNAPFHHEIESELAVDALTLVVDVDPSLNFES